VRLSDLARLDAAELDQLLALLDEALGAPREADGTHRVRTADGRLDLVLRRPPGDRPWVVLVTPLGRLRCRDYLLEIAPIAVRRELALEDGS